MFPDHFTILDLYVRFFFINSSPKILNYLLNCMLKALLKGFSPPRLSFLKSRWGFLHLILGSLFLQHENLNVDYEMRSLKTFLLSWHRVFYTVWIHTCTSGVDLMICHDFSVNHFFRMNYLVFLFLLPVIVIIPSLTFFVHINCAWLNVCSQWLDLEAFLDGVYSCCLPLIINESIFTLIVDLDSPLCKSSTMFKV